MVTPRKPGATDFCNIVDPIRNGRCLAPPGYSTGGGGFIRGDKRTSSTCYACGLHVCVNCSTRRNWGKHGRHNRVRVCRSCQEERKLLRKRHDTKGSGLVLSANRKEC